ncbi:hypothetical protein ED733_005306 [Metarhizium rileyi]|uniref:Uncharacterized protein n=1 Tax=Metarhizium rileyi (strain RCEF 4871) TaxID=1649241 RepID=A0A5C6GHP9_METRR|nr:hypothetical protein ED733_005306 [Metarhizium rileyi]
MVTRASPISVSRDRTLIERHGHLQRELSAFLAYGLHLRGKGYLAEGWRYTFLIKGILTGLIGVWTWMDLLASTTQTAHGKYKGLLRPKEGWFRDREEVIMDGLSWAFFKDALLDYHLWPIDLLGRTWSIPVTPPQASITLTCKALGINTFETNLLTISGYTIFITQLLFWTWVSEKVNQRLLIDLITQFWALPLLIALSSLCSPRWRTATGRNGSCRLCSSAIHTATLSL